MKPDRRPHEPRPLTAVSDALEQIVVFLVIALEADGGVVVITEISNPTRRLMLLKIGYSLVGASEDLAMRRRCGKARKG